MPLYEYECPSHGKFERLQNGFDPSDAPCPECKAPARKVFSSFSFTFKTYYGTNRAEWQEQNVRRERQEVGLSNT